MRRTVAILIAVVLALLLLAPSAGACEPSRGREAAAHDMSAMDHGASGTMPDCGDPGVPAPSRSGCDHSGSPGCPASHSGACAAMTGCSGIAAVVPVAPVLASPATERVTLVATQHALVRATAPELPPPRA